ncbi:hypothetical protein EVAR_79153_1 [Eumeta japonica]|uniref:Mos1 transposase HTH domain-containing protein n=1 Tax=Eumeta variegata TaxID=151549 RepID=A0A4C1UUX3_EUMVA|nr:hypothetical protein EVAR_79153_1 [Eumeta japonica]
MLRLSEVETHIKKKVILMAMSPPPRKPALRTSSTTASENGFLAGFRLTFNDEAPSLATDNNWFNDFKRGRTNLTDDQCKGRPSMVTTEDNVGAARLMIQTKKRGLTSRFGQDLVEKNIGFESSKQIKWAKIGGVHVLTIDEFHYRAPSGSAANCGPRPYLIRRYRPPAGAGAGSRVRKQPDGRRVHGHRH